MGQAIISCRCVNCQYHQKTSITSSCTSVFLASFKDRRDLTVGLASESKAPYTRVRIIACAVEASPAMVKTDDSANRNSQRNLSRFLVILCSFIFGWLGRSTSNAEQPLLLREIQTGGISNLFRSSYQSQWSSVAVVLPYPAQALFVSPCLKSRLQWQILLETSHLGRAC